MNKKPTPKEAIRMQCSDCLGMVQFNRRTVANCEGDQAYVGPCLFFPYRLGKRPSVKVFRKFCLQCMGGSSLLVADCRTEHCAAHPYRRGTNPALKGRRGASKDAMASNRTQKGALIQVKISQNQLSLPGIG